MSQPRPNAQRYWLLVAVAVAILFVAAIAGAAGVRALPGAVAAVCLVAIVSALCVVVFLGILALLPALILVVASAVGFRAYYVAVAGFGWVRMDGRWKQNRLPNFDFSALVSPGD